MNTHADKTQEKKSQSVANTVSQKQRRGESTFQFVDNRPEAVAQRKLQEMANNSPQAKQAAQLQAMANHHSLQQQQPILKKENNTGLPDNLKTRMENLSGMSLDDVKVHRNSDKPASVQAHAYTQGNDIHIAPGQEKHLPHEAWHVAQQQQGRVQPTTEVAGMPVNDNAGLEKEADAMGAKAAQRMALDENVPIQKKSYVSSTVQRIAWHEKANGTGQAAGAPNINVVNNTGATQQINVSGYMFDGPMYTLPEVTNADDKVDLVADISAGIGGMTNPTNDRFLSKRQLERNLTINQTVPFANIGAMTPANQNIYRGRLDPYSIKAAGQTIENERIALHYQFGVDSYGYIVKIEQEGKTYTMHGGRGQEALSKDQVAELSKGNTTGPEMDQFSSAHDTGDADESIAEVASQSTEDRDLTLYPMSKKKNRVRQIGKLEEKSKRLDAIAKIGGEGARWQCVREQAKAGKLTNGTRFYALNWYNGNNGYVGMTFQDLWGGWATDFNSDFDIDDDTVRDKLLELYDMNDDRIVTMEDEDITDKDYSLN
jgi:hypothetical protein